MSSEVKTRSDYREGGKYQFVVGYLSFGAPQCVHLSFEELACRFRSWLGPGTLQDDGVWLTFTPFESTRLTKNEG